MKPASKRAPAEKRFFSGSKSDPKRARAILSSVSSLVLALALLAPSDRTITNEHYNVRIDAPIGWAVQKQIAYPSVVAVMAHRDGGRMTLSAERARSAETAQTLAERNRAAMEKKGMRVTHLAPLPGNDAVEVEATTQNGSLAMRQVYFVRGLWGFSLTLTAPPSKIAQYAHDLDVAWRSVGPMK
jgi:hypothetical protein